MEIKIRFNHMNLIMEDTEKLLFAYVDLCSKIEKDHPNAVVSIEVEVG